MGAIPLTLHLKVKYPTHGRVGELVGDQAMARKCLVSAVTQQSSSHTAVNKDAIQLQPKGAANGKCGNRAGSKAVFPSRFTVATYGKGKIGEVPKVNIDIFAWNAYNVPGINPELACHQLNVNPEAVPCKQPPRQSSKDHTEVVKVEVNKSK